MTRLAEVRQLVAGYGDARVLHGVDLDVDSGQVTAIIGSNGAGKTTLFRTLAGLLPTLGGTISFAGQVINNKPSHVRVRDGLLLVPEGRLIFPEMTVEENLNTGAINSRARVARDATRKSVYTLFPVLAERRRQAGNTLSGGEQQMLALGRGLMGQPRLLLLDEPTLGLAPAIAEQIFALIPLLIEMRVSVLIAEQDITRTLQVADQAYVLENGRVKLQDTGERLLRNPAIREAYLGR